jgi:ATP-dependent Lon protease
MTGELTLTGRVLPIGGLKEKILGAVRAGISEIILPKENEADLEDIPEEVAETLTFHCVEDLDQGIAIALLDEKGARPKKAAPKGGSKKARKSAPKKDGSGNGEEATEIQA